MTSNDKPYYIRASRDKQDTAFLKYDIKTTLQEVIIPKGLKCSKGSMTSLETRVALGTENLVQQSGC